MAPVGSRIHFSYAIHSVPKEWQEHPSVSYITKGGGIVETPAMYEVATAATTIAMDVPNFGGLPTWSRDSKAFVVTSPSPLGSAWEKDDIENHRSNPGKANLF